MAIDTMITKITFNVLPTIAQYGQTPLHLACEKGHTEIVKKLLADPRVDVNRNNKVESLIVVMYNA